MMTLRNAEIGATYRVRSLNLNTVVMRRLEALGLTRETPVKIINRSRSGSVIIMVRGSRLAIGRNIADAIQMEST